MSRSFNIFGFHSIESIIENNPEQIKKVLLPSSRNDKRLTQLKLLLDEAGISYESSNKFYHLTNLETFKKLKDL